MIRFWLFLAAFQDVFPWLCLFFIVFRRFMRYSRPFCHVVGTLTMLFYEIGFPFFSEAVNYRFDYMLWYRMGQLLIFGLLAFWLVKNNVRRIAFVFGNLYPMNIFLVVLSCFIAKQAGFEMEPLYRTTSLVRLGLSAVLIPCIWMLWKHYLIPVMRVQQDIVWRYAWHFPAIFTLVGICFTRSDFETAGVSVYELCGAAIIFAGVLYLSYLLFHIMQAAQANMLEMEQAKRSQMLLQVQAGQYQTLTANMQELRRVRHDIRQHVRILTQLCKEERYAQLQEYLQELEQVIPTDTITSYCANLPVNALCNYYVQNAAKCGIAFEIQLQLPEQLNIKETDLCIAIGNLMENAIEAVTACKEKRVVTMQAKCFGNCFYLIICNPYNAYKQIDETSFLSAKKEYLEEGVGLPSVKAVAQKYQGQLLIHTEDQMFRVELMMKNE